MQITLDLPEDICLAVSSGTVTLQQAALEGLACEGYRNGTLSESQLMRLLELPSRFAVHQWLAEPQIPQRYTESDLADDLATLTKLGFR
ncbi:MAG: UPF0175 family protein [Bryobacterales bacterium]|nr:UPF0175 family protein [Bryobacterales bacterium]